MLKDSFIQFIFWLLPGSMLNAIFFGSIELLSRCFKACHAFAFSIPPPLALALLFLSFFLFFRVIHNPSPLGQAISSEDVAEVYYIYADFTFIFPKFVDIQISLQMNLYRRVSYKKLK